MSKQNVDTKNSNFEMILHSAIELPGVKINRADFLRKELSKHFDKDVVEKAIEKNPAQAGLSLKNIERLAKECIKYETVKVTAISAAAGIPSGLAMIGTVPVDIAQFFGHIVRILQKLVYLYGWQEMFQDDRYELDDTTSNQLTLFIGVMFGVGAANAVVTKIANAVALKAEKTLVQKALTKGTIYPIIKKISQSIGIRMTKVVFANSVGKIIPVIGAVVSGGITFAGFTPMAKRLQKYLITLPMANIDFYRQPLVYDDVIDINFSDISIEDDVESYTY